MVKARLAIVGGGITGLSAAFQFRRRLLEQPPASQLASKVVSREPDENQFDCLVLEASPRLGGRVRTERHDGFLVEAAADSLVTQKPQGLELCRELGIEDQLIEPRPSSSPTTQVVRGDRLLTLPDGLQLVAPTKTLPLLTSKLFSVRGKIRLLRERRMRPETPKDDEPLGAFISRRFGAEAFERVVEPVMGGLFTTDARTLSTRLVAPRLVALEQRFGSVTRGILETERGTTQTPPPPQVALEGGMQTLVDRLVEVLDRDSLWTKARVRRLEFDAHQQAWKIDPLGRPTVLADYLVLALPGHVASPLLSKIDDQVSGEAATLEYASCATVSLGYRRTAFRRLPRGFGFFVPSGEHWPFLACSYPSRKFAGRADEDRVLLRAFVGGALAPEAMERNDSEMITAVRAGLERLLTLRGEPELSLVHRHERAMPQFVAGYGASIERLETRLCQLPGLGVAGSLKGAYGLADCIRSGREAADRAIEHLRKSSQ